MELSTFKKKAPTTAWFDFSPGMRVELEYISPEEVRKRAKYSTKIEQGREVFDEEKLLVEMASRILSWEGFTLGRVARIMDIEVPEDQADSAVPCTETNKLELLKKSWLFKPFVESRTVSLEEFKTDQRELERKNSLRSPSGPSAAESAAGTAGK
ncbi:MAG TPA: hypothetical protein DCS05_04225 [Nitrospiraceae bacterium]|nr:hypothetical protein [Nitrospiraceae bacterium]